MPLVLDVATHEPIAWTCDFCGELCHKPAEQFMHRIDCAEGKRRFAQKAARDWIPTFEAQARMVKSVMNVTDHMERYSPEEAAAHLAVLKDLEPRSENRSEWKIYEILMYVLRRRMEGLPAFDVELAETE